METEHFCTIANIEPILSNSLLSQYIEKVLYTRAPDWNKHYTHDPIVNGQDAVQGVRYYCMHPTK